MAIRAFLVLTIAALTIAPGFPFGTTAGAADDYLLPPQAVVDIVDAPSAPAVGLSPDGQRMLLSMRPALPTIADLSQPMCKIAGYRINPATTSRFQTTFTTALEIVDIASGARRAVQTPDGGQLGVASFSPDGAHLAFSIHTDLGVELWLADVATGAAKRLGDFMLNGTLSAGFSWKSSSETLLVHRIPPGRGAAPREPQVPSGPIIAETSGRAATTRTYQDLLQSPFDEALFEHYFTSELGRVDLEGHFTRLGEPGIYLSADPSPDGQKVLVTRVKRPYSYVVPASDFAQATEVWNPQGEVLWTVVDRAVADDVPIGGVVTGPRSIRWMPHEASTLMWAEAQDRGDPNVEVPHRDQLFALAITADQSDRTPRELGKTVMRFRGATFTDQKDVVLVSEYDIKKRWTRAAFRDFSAAGAPDLLVLTDRSSQDRYGDPGRLVDHALPNGDSVAIVRDGALFLSGSGASATGERPFLDRMLLKDGTKTRLFESPADKYTTFVDFVGDVRGAQTTFVVRQESPTSPPNYYLTGPDRDLSPLTDFPDPHPQLTGIRKELVRYERADGVPLSGTLYLPPEWEEGTRLPLVIWAYPVEYSSAAVAGQVRTTTNRFTRLSGTSPLMFLTQGYAVLDGAAMPVVGDSQTMNDTFIEQIVAAAAAAIDAMVRKGVAEPDKVGVGGHSYGAFMTANLLAHSNLFQAGIARSGAYNRSLTPFGFQSERRTLWEAPETYVAVSPFFHAGKINQPLLMIHGDDDNNSGTFPIQSQRLFHAMQGLGGTARYVRLPKESHGYSARESVLHTLAESFAWFDRYVKHPVVHEE